MLGSAPGGLGYLAEVFEAAKLSSQLEDRSAPDLWLPKSIAYLKRRYPGRIRARWINPHTPYGMLLALRYHIRTYPALLAEGGVIGPFSGAKAFEAYVASALSRSPVEGHDS
jgi:hypothetical protein